MPTTSRNAAFILEAFDREQWCPVLQARFVADVDVLRAALGLQPDDDPELRSLYELDHGELAAVVAAFGVAFDPAPLGPGDRDFRLCRTHSIDQAPYLVHTGYELPLLLDGRKKLARMGDCYPPMKFPGEERFDHWVSQGVLHRVEVLQPFDPPTRRWHGHRTVYYTPKGEEWRIPAMQLIWHASSRADEWNEYFERLEGMLFGYEDWQNEWWIKTGVSRGWSFTGAAMCCPVSAAGLAWLEAAGYRALPPCDSQALAIRTYEYNDPAATLPSCWSRKAASR